jgi:hypothetical protein
LNFRDYNAIMCFSVDVKCQICFMLIFHWKSFSERKNCKVGYLVGQLKAHALSEILNSSKPLPYSERTSAAWWHRSHASQRRTDTQSSLKRLASLSSIDSRLVSMSTKRSSIWTYPVSINNSDGVELWGWNCS